ncbi:MAG: release factor glutamine methyltransferase [Candidatus Mesenet longicola]|uniref:peptide chain release factor N(5)-glutamine methyltransferase n=1 Tax=Candidatus Mesenet longicola TaxID=1892558 RepID=A0A8J3HU06_9RICK|nr:MAG: release factor glutamine methyltransferase [Candidatus Mesenet longicola]GHM59024.1 MAG: release factor glutamine methyltransferase [Candidatus Mesenet longicola]
MKTISALLKESINNLSLCGIYTPRLDSEILIGHVLGLERSFIIANYDYEVEEEHEKSFLELISKRCKRYPIAQIIGKREFWGLDFLVNQHVLDPRPDSETIILAVLKYYRNKNTRLRIVDFGTGTGCLLISILHEYKHSIGIGFEKNVNSYRVALSNIKKHTLLSRAKIVLGSWENSNGLFDLIISNPPYIKKSMLKKLQPEVQNEPIIALDGGSNGLKCYLSILPILKRSLKKGGFAILEIGESQNNIKKIIPFYGLIFVSYAYDLSGNKRCIIIRQP